MKTAIEDILFVVTCAILCWLSILKSYASVTNFTSYAATSTVYTVPAENLNFAMGMADGTLYDPSPDKRLTRGITSATLTAITRHSEEIVSGAYEGMTNALAAFYSATNNASKWTNKVSICADMFPSVSRTNMEAYILNLTTSANGETNVFYLHFNKVPDSKPKVFLRYSVSSTESFESSVNVKGWPLTETVEGYEGYRCECVVPEAARGILLRTDPFVRFGSEKMPFSFSDSGFQCVSPEGTFYWGWTTNWTPEGVEYKRWKSGCLMGSTTNKEDVL